jgi:hypothetical protein
MISSCTDKTTSATRVSVKRVISRSDREDACRKLVATGSCVKTQGATAETRGSPSP